MGKFITQKVTEGRSSEDPRARDVHLQTEGLPLDDLEQKGVVKRFFICCDARKSGLSETRGGCICRDTGRLQGMELGQVSYQWVIVRRGATLSTQTARQ